MSDHTDLMNRAAIAAAEAIRAVYARDFAALAKADGSPVTEADEAAERIILAHLAETGIPVLAEESVAAGHIPELGERYFVVDPLDGTKEFVKRNGEFTVNIAYCEAGAPVSGVVLAPATEDIYWGGPDGAFSGRVVGGAITDAQPLRTVETGPLRIVASRSHGHAALADLCSELSVSEDVSVGSSLKFCLLARGDAQLYPRFTPTSEWDTAAGQALLQGAGGVVLRLDGTPLTCGHRAENFLNGWFVAAATEALARRALEAMRRHAG
ncbi:MAG: 3'(2'),5'-bisphosphate nucleotidase CysQ [Devosia sp.]